jgi:anti-sigma B factor antagonist
LIVLQRRVDASQGKLRLCELSKTVDAVMKTTNLDRLFGIDRDRAAALTAFE